MIRLRLFGRCQIYHEPVTPVMKQSAQIGWEAWFREIDLVTPRRLKGRELLSSTKGYWTVDPKEIEPIVEKYGRLVVGDKGELMVEFDNEQKAEKLSEELNNKFDKKIMIAP